MSSGTPSFQVLNRWMSPVSRTRTVGAERPGPRRPQSRRTGHIADIHLSAEYEEIEAPSLAASKLADTNIFRVMVVSNCH